MCINSARHTTEDERDATTNATGDSTEGFPQLPRAALEGRERGREGEGRIARRRETGRTLRERGTEFRTAVVRGTPPSSKVGKQVGISIHLTRLAVCWLIILRAYTHAYTRYIFSSFFFLFFLNTLLAENAQRCEKARRLYGRKGRRKPRCALCAVLFCARPDDDARARWRPTDVYTRALVFRTYTHTHAHI